MLNRKAAADTASKHLIELVPTSGAPVLEEYFYADGVWQITLSYLPASTHANNGSDVAKEYKSFAIDGRSGEIISMKIRSVKG